ncbi:4-hydroxybenzoate octaprenyltransferase [Teredinibacter sp. KSP-S5-2]|uniref:4-hydroxybenzoate octaprenyltransferase n=1 Tax=Teredinibacter sp. KSP-S5-2 TaxID=3034506 RepID=UPI0029347FA5|nr:4-hydroxybenzoate octaprenyltransferase [Teredinibacter sp. KSP-S5-2]WNO09274.1 4-hydroxybenzoate octaprenyltransferase [Teredinibacter sp. KSP-S5-2]
MKQKISAYLNLTRLNKPIGIYLVLWPTLWSLWLAADGIPRIDILIIFTLGCVLMRSAGCVINDFADRKVDGHVKRTANRPLVTGIVSASEAFILFLVLSLTAFGMVLLTNQLTIQLSFAAVALAFCYPFMKRHTHLPQVVLGAAFAMSVPMAFAAQANELPESIWLVYTTVVLWTVTYDTFYAMVDRDDDLKIGVKSTAVLFGDSDKAITGILQVMTIVSLMMIGSRFELGFIYQLSVVICAGFFAYQQYLVRDRNRQACFTAFLNNNYVGMVIFIGIVLDKTFGPITGI